MEIIFYLIIFVILCSFAYAGISGAPWVPSKKFDVARFLKLADIKQGQKVYDLGCGDGRLLFPAAELGAVAEGFEISIIPLFLAKFRKLFSGKKINVKIRFKSFWSADLRDADVVFIFLLPKAFPKLREKLESELRPGARVLVHVWPIDGWNPAKIDRKENYCPLYLYVR
ncbi:class I SAM-dependent methyltransferase [Patescibacteria group bacterium]|nr:class I SAM-dependent methyltransferase [Patescibacteria group bacterium]